MSSENQFKKPSRKYKNIIITIPRFEPFEFRQLRDQFLKRYRAVIFWPFYDNGEIYGYAIPYVIRSKKYNEKLLDFEERLVRDIALANASEGEKIWIEIQSWGITTIRI